MQATTLQSMMNAKLSPYRFWPCHENGLIGPIHLKDEMPFQTEIFSPEGKNLA